jgi:hypothetical protein
VYWGEPTDWSHFQGVLQADYTSYPGNPERHNARHIAQQCDNCRMLIPAVPDLNLVGIGEPACWPEPVKGGATIRLLREARHLAETRIKQFAAKVYGTFDQNERLLVRFGMFPADKMKTAQADLAAELEQDDGTPFDPAELSRLLAVGIMDAANAGEDKMVV